MNSLLHSSDDQSIRTQITLTSRLKTMIEDQAGRQGISLSEYLRQAAVIKHQSDMKKNLDRKKLASRVIGSLNLKNHPQWSTPQKVYAWSRKVREEWAR